MSEITTEAGRRLLDGAWYLDPGEPLMGDSIAAIEKEARQGYVPISLSPEWHAEMKMAAADGAAAERARLVEEVRALEGRGESSVSWGEGWNDAIATVLAMLEGDR